ncbi:MAG: hypothetical protein JWL90_613 [Chthoniobacteraceae bacterium]|nr:hypothetical protein [Chthoniobacteraceae bacterium]
MELKIKLWRLKNTGSTILTALGAMTALTLLAGVALTRISASYRVTFQSGSWEEALRAAEAGAELAMASLNELSVDSTTAWAGWSAADASGVRTRVYSASSTPPLPAHTGEGNTKMYASLRVDPIKNGNRTWYRIRSIGTVEVPGGRAMTRESALKDVNGTKNARSMLRKITFLTDRTGSTLKLPQTSRAIELVAQPTTAPLFQRGFTAQSALTMSGGVYTDSFDSSDALKSTAGRYDPLKHGSKGSIATNSIGDLSNLGDSYVWGSVMSNGGAISRIDNVQGEIINNFKTELPAVTTPKWTTIISNPSKLTGIQTLAAGTEAAPSRYKVTSIDLGSKDRLTIANPTPGQASYVEIWCTGDMKTNAQAVFILQPGVFAKFFVEGNFSIAGGGVDNQSSNAANLLLYGISPTDGTSRQFKLTGSADFTGVIYCPGYDFVSTGNGSFQGAVVCKTATIKGNAGFHYDEALKNVDSDTVGGYQMDSWVEDIR